jgi:purine-binding chemotaxis protein CheW
LVGKYLVFIVADESYAVTISRVQEIISMARIDTVPHTPAHVRGMTNLRGVSVPVWDARLCFGLEQGEDTRRTCMIIVSAEDDNIERNTARALVVDRVLAVHDFHLEQLEEPPSFGTLRSNDAMLGIAREGDDLIQLLSIDRVFDGVAAKG